MNKTCRVSDWISDCVAVFLKRVEGGGGKEKDSSERNLGRKGSKTLPSKVLLYLTYKEYAKTKKR